MSELSDRIYSLLKECYPNAVVDREVYVNYENERLFFDFCLFDFIFIEVQGQQHYKYVEHFHRDKFNYVKAVRRDRLKREWIASNNYKLIEIKYDIVDKLDKQSVQKLIFDILGDSDV